MVFVLVNLLLSRILLRFPKLKVVFAESSLGWGTYLLEYGDHQAEQRSASPRGPDDCRTEHAHAAIAGNISYRLSGDDATGIETIRPDVVRFILSNARICVNPSTANLAAQYGPLRSFPFFPCGDEILIIEPPPRGRMIFRASRLHKNVPLRLCREL
jgi:hypothetical protein